MKTKTPIWIRLVFLTLIILSALGIFEEQAFAFLTEVAKKNSGFLLAVSEVNMIVSGISSINVPFVSGSTTALETSLDKVQDYLLLTDTLSFLQVMLVSIGKSWIFKAFLLGLFILTFLEKRHKFFMKLLIIALALSPGLSIYTLAINKVAQTASIDYGDKYLKELKTTVQTVKEENTQLSQQHEKNLTQIENGTKGIKILRRFREDVSYDLKKADNSISGDFKEIRTLIKSAGHEMTVKISRFCTMILFSLLILPVGYALIIYMLFKTFFGRLVLAHEIGLSYPHEPQEAQTTSKNKKSFSQKLLSIYNTIKNELKDTEEKWEHPIDPPEAKKENPQAKEQIKPVEENVKAKVKPEIPKGVSEKDTHKPTATNTPPPAATSPATETTESQEPANTKHTKEATSQKKTSNSQEGRKKIKRSPGSILGI